MRNWLAVQVPRRFWALLEERRRGGAVDQGALDRFRRDVPAYVRDFRLEPPSFTPRRYLEIERERLEVCRTDSPEVDSRYEGVYRLLREFQAALGGKLLVVLIPDEYQVSDPLWAELARKPAGLDRALPQKRIGAFCRRSKIAVLDLLPVLTAAQRGGPVYHLRDTHWNARGNRLAGEAIADWIAKRGF